MRLSAYWPLVFHRLPVPELASSEDAEVDKILTVTPERDDEVIHMPYMSDIQPDTIASSKASPSSVGMGTHAVCSVFHTHIFHSALKILETER